MNEPESLDDALERVPVSALIEHAAWFKTFAMNLRAQGAPADVTRRAINASQMYELMAKAANERQNAAAEEDA